MEIVPDTSIEDQIPPPEAEAVPPVEEPTLGEELSFKWEKGKADFQQSWNYVLGGIADIFLDDESDPIVTRDWFDHLRETASSDPQMPVEFIEGERLSQVQHKLDIYRAAKRNNIKLEDGEPDISTLGTVLGIPEDLILTSGTPQGLTSILLTGGLSNIAAKAAPVLFKTVSRKVLTEGAILGQGFAAGEALQAEMNQEDFGFDDYLTSLGEGLIFSGAAQIGKEIVTGIGKRLKSKDFRDVFKDAYKKYVGEPKGYSKDTVDRAIVLSKEMEGQIPDIETEIDLLYKDIARFDSDLAKLPEGSVSDKERLSLKVRNINIDERLDKSIDRFVKGKKPTLDGRPIKEVASLENTNATLGIMAAQGDKEADKLIEQSVITRRVWDKKGRLAIGFEPLTPEQLFINKHKWKQNSITAALTESVLEGNLGDSIDITTTGREGVKRTRNITLFRDLLPQGYQLTQAKVGNRLFYLNSDQVTNAALASFSEEPFITDYIHELETNQNALNDPNISEKKRDELIAERDELIANRNMLIERKGEQRAVGLAWLMKYMGVKKEEAVKQAKVIADSVFRIIEEKVNEIEGTVGAEVKSIQFVGGTMMYTKKVPEVFPADGGEPIPQVSRNPVFYQSIIDPGTSDGFLDVRLSDLGIAIKKDHIEFPQSNIELDFSKMNVSRYRVKEEGGLFSIVEQSKEEFREMMQRIQEDSPDVNEETFETLYNDTIKNLASIPDFAHILGGEKGHFIATVEGIATRKNIVKEIFDELEKCLKENL